MTDLAVVTRRTLWWRPWVGISALLAILGAEAVGLIGLHYLFKPLTTLLIAAMVWRLPAHEPVYRRAVLAGLALSLLGDVFLMLPGDWFAFGLGSFLLAHLAYLRALRSRGPWFRPLFPLLGYVLIAGGVLVYLWPHVPAPLKAPVAVYVLALAAMASQAACIFHARPGAATRSAAWGGLLFVVSDAMLAIDKFASPIAHVATWVLITYWLAQWGIARSVSVARSGDFAPPP
jgi:uncharacterized membrane protein YhhN